ncbi:Shikimate kinase [Planctomycetales bacterium 10988]|nr:Shikimate kinase [Planctomycetales bacterium 10988]
MSQRMILIGYRGTGKTTIARELSRLLHWPWLDADIELERNSGRSIGQIFAEEGEPAFRKYEAVLLRQLLKREPLILATGGGVIIDPKNRSRIKKAGGMVVWLDATLEILLARLHSDSPAAHRRPALTERSAEEEVKHLLEQRRPWYEECADWRLPTELQRPSDLARQIVQHFELPTVSSEWS